MSCQCIYMHVQEVWLARTACNKVCAMTSDMQSIPTARLISNDNNLCIDYELAAL